MLTHLGPLHAIAARRGDGLRSELARLLILPGDPPKNRVQCFLLGPRRSQRRKPHSRRAGR